MEEGRGGKGVEGMQGSDSFFFFINNFFYFTTVQQGGQVILTYIHYNYIFSPTLSSVAT